MFDRSLVTSGFDVEVLVSEEYLSYLLLAQAEAGFLPFRSTYVDDETGDPYEILLHPPDAADYVRRYEPHPEAAIPEGISGSIGPRLLADNDVADMRLLVWATVTNLTTGEVNGPSPALLEFNLDIVAGRVSDAGFESRHSLRLDFLGFEDGTTVLLEAAGVDVPELEAAIREQVPRDSPLGVAQGQQVHQIRMRRFVDGDQRSLGLYINLALHSAPDAFVPARGDVAGAQDFRPAGAPIAFATALGLFALLGPDAFARQAEPNEAGTGWRYPLREDPFDLESDEVGTIKDISVGPELLGIPPIPTGRLEIDIHGEYTDAAGDPDFHLRLLFRPTRDADGVVTWDLDVDVNLGLLATLLLIAAGIGLTLLFGPGLGWGSTLVIGSLLGVAVLKGLIAEPLAARIVSDRLDTESQASVLDVLPFQVPGARRRWDPFYTIEHLVVALVDEDVVVDQAGIAFVGARLALDKRPVPTDHVVIRDEDRAVGSVSGLRYRVSDFARIAADLAAIAPGTDRLPFTRNDAVAQPQLVSLTLEQIAERIAANRLLAPLVYTAERISMFEGQIDQILVLSTRERLERAAGVEADFRARMRAVIVAEYGDTILATIAEQLEEELGMPPTEEQLDAAFDAHVNRIIDGLITPFRRDLLPNLLDAAVARTLRFDLPPDDLIELQQSGVLALDGVEIIVRHNANGIVTPYYRDHPDGNLRDNLLSLRHYRSPYQPPA